MGRMNYCSRVLQMLLLAQALLVASSTTVSQRRKDFLRDFLKSLRDHRPSETLNEVVVSATKVLNTPSNILGGFCRWHSDCGEASGATCVKGRCRCAPYYLQINRHQCLPGVLLGFRCGLDAQCNLRVENSGCIQGFCRCSDGFVPYRRSNCLPAAEVGEVCRSDSQCQLNSPDSYCKFLVPKIYGKCGCQAGAVQFGSGCRPRNYTLGSSCSTSTQCSSHVPNSVCLASTTAAKPLPRISCIPGVNRDMFVLDETDTGICSCPSGYAVSEDGTQCIPLLKVIGVTAASLGQQCHTDAQCRAADPHSFCSDRVCTCIVRSSKCSASKTGCYSDTFQCVTDGRCISWYYVCNGVRDCTDGSDEAACVPHHCPSLAFTCHDGSCISRAKVCDGIAHCPDGSDETSCEGEGCPSFMFRCNNRRCLPGFVFCNAIASCSDSSDEDETACVQGSPTVSYCPFRCDNGRCRSTAVLCSGKDGCGDNSDEKNCHVCTCPRS